MSLVVSAVGLARVLLCCSGCLLIGERCDLLLLDLVVGEVLLVLLPAGARGAGHVCGSGGAGFRVCSWRSLGRGVVAAGREGDGWRATLLECCWCGRGWVVMATAVTASRRSELWLGLVVPAAVALQNNFGRQQPRAFTPRYPSFCLCLPHNTQDGRTSRKQRECCLQGRPPPATAHGCPRQHTH